MRIGVRDAGVYRVTADEVALVSGWDADTVRAAMAQGGVALACGGAAVTWRTEDALFLRPADKRALRTGKCLLADVGGWGGDAASGRAGKRRDQSLVHV